MLGIRRPGSGLVEICRARCPPTLACGAVGLGKERGAAQFPWTEAGDKLSASPPHQVLISRASQKASVTRRK